MKSRCFTMINKRYDFSKGKIIFCQYRWKPDCLRSDVKLQEEPVFVFVTNILTGYSFDNVGKQLFQNTCKISIEEVIRWVIFTYILFSSHCYNIIIMIYVVNLLFILFYIFFFEEKETLLSYIWKFYLKFWQLSLFFKINIT